MCDLENFNVKRFHLVHWIHGVDDLLLRVAHRCDRNAHERLLLSFEHSIAHVLHELRVRSIRRPHVARECEHLSEENKYP